MAACCATLLLGCAEGAPPIVSDGSSKIDLGLDGLAQGGAPTGQLVSGAGVATGGSYTLVSQLGLSMAGDQQPLKGSNYSLTWDTLIIPW